MPKATILLADNDRWFAETRAEFLKESDYQVIFAHNPAQAKEIAQQGGIDLAILDLRLTDDTTERDHSGLDVAKEINPSIPKIMLTGFPSYDVLREALRPPTTNGPLFVDFLSKMDGPEALISSIERILAALQSYETINVELILHYDFDSFSDKEKARILRRLRNLLDFSGEIPVVSIEPGSTKITIALTCEQAEQLFWLYERGVLDELNIEDAKIIGNTVAAAIVHSKAQSNDYDVFMCHNSEDKPVVKRIALRLRGRGILPWLDEWELRPGLPWQQALEERIDSIKSAAVFAGDSGFGPWQNMELNAFIRQFVQRQCPVIPVLLRTCTCVPTLPPFLNGMTWVSFRKRNPNPYDQLVWGITGKKP